MSATLSIFTSKQSNRLQYVSDLLFTQLLGLPIEFVTDENEVYVKECVLNYSAAQGVGFHVKPAKLLFEKKIVAQEFKTGKWLGVPTIYVTTGADLSFDILSATFFLVSRYEEYLPFKGDKHDRFDAEQSVAYQNGFLDQPIINVWAHMLADELMLKYPQLEITFPTGKFINTIDVDYAYAFLEKGPIRSIGAALRDTFTFNFQVLRKRLNVLFGISKDPFDTFEDILTLQKRYCFQSVFFFHVGDYDVNDKSIPITSDTFQSLIKNVNDYAQVGVHPSYAASQTAGKLSVELKRLADVIHQPVTQSRHHFMKLTLPKTYRELIELDVKEDYTMGYASKMGFRASICVPFYFYDLDFDESTNLKVYPFCTMEATSKYYLNQTPQESWLAMKRYIDLVKQFNGTYVSVWHNDAISEWGQWQGWKNTYIEMVEYASKLFKN